MVEIQEMTESSASPSPSEERLMDAEEIEQVARTLKRPTARMQLESLAKKLRREAAALKVVESQEISPGTTASAPGPSTPAPTKPVVPAEQAPKKPVAVTPPLATTAGSSVLFSAIDRFSFDAGGYDDKFVTLYVPLPGVGDIPKDQVQCDFQKASFDLIVKDLNGKSYRLKKDNLEHDIMTDKSKVVIKADKVLVKLAKEKDEYGSFAYWSKLTDAKRKDKKRTDPAGSITEMMKDMYDSGDDNMRKIIGESMMKQQRGELGKGGMGGMGGAGFDDF
jgi:calcyclin binding protein